MSQASLEERVQTLEEQVRELMARVLSPPNPKDWRSLIGRFSDEETCRAIDEEGRKIREADREQARRDHS
jgi:hypothetical protein